MPNDWGARITRLFRYMGVASNTQGAREIGVTKHEVSRWMKGRCTPSTLARIRIECLEQQYLPQEDEQSLPTVTVGIQG